MSAAQGRLVRMDILRGMAVFGILLVNIWGFVWGVSALRYGHLGPQAPLADQAAVFLVSAFAETKFYPIFAFLFGAGLALQMRGLRAREGGWPEAARRYRRRLAWLMVCGALHGILLWQGDVLLSYGVTGLFVVGMAGARPARVLRSLRRWLILFAVVMLLLLAVMLSAMGSGEELYGKSDLENIARMHAAYVLGTYPDALARRAVDYATILLEMLFAIPHIAALFLLGVLSVRLGWLTRPSRRTAFWRRVRFWGLALGVPFNLAFAAMTLWAGMDPQAAVGWSAVASTVLFVGGPALSAAYCAMLMLAREQTVARLAPWLAPVGRLALSNYLLQSLLCVLLLQVADLGAVLSRAQVVLLAFAIMAAQLWWSRLWLARFTIGPFEALLRRYSRGAPARVAALAPPQPDA